MAPTPTARGKRASPPPPLKPIKSDKTFYAATARPKQTLSSLLRMQNIEDSKPRVSKISWLDDVLVYHSSILPVVLRPVLFFTGWSAAVAIASIVYGKDLALTNNVVPLLSVVVGLLLVFRNSSAYERYAEGRKDFTSLLSNARNLSRAVWINVVPPPDRHMSPQERRQLTEEKKRVIRLILGFAFATKHYLRSEGGVNHADLQGLLPRSLVEFAQQGSEDDDCECAVSEDGNDDMWGAPTMSSPKSYSTPAPPQMSPRSYSTPSFNDQGDAERGVAIGRNMAPPSSPTRTKSNSISIPRPEPPTGLPTPSSNRPRPQRRPTAVRVRPMLTDEKTLTVPSNASSVSERTPLIKSGVRSDIRRTHYDVDSQTATLDNANKLGRMVEVGLPLIIAHEISRTLFRFRRRGNLEAVGPAGFNSMNAMVQNMIDQLGSMERIIQTPLPYVFTSHLKQCVTIYLLCLPFVLVDVLGWKSIFIVAIIAFTLCGVEGIAAQVEMPFGTDPSDLNLDLFCTELLCECEAILERLPEGDEDEEINFVRTPMQVFQDEMDG